MKQTAVEYLLKELSEILGPLKTEAMQDLLLVDAINKSKEMEKQQIIDAIYNAQKTDFYVKYYNVEQYIDEIFKKK
jgi:hypothetical protein